MSMPIFGIPRSINRMYVILLDINEKSLFVNANNTLWMYCNVLSSSIYDETIIIIYWKYFCIIFYLCDCEFVSTNNWICNVGKIKFRFCLRLKWNLLSFPLESIFIHMNVWFHIAYWLYCLWVHKFLSTCPLYWYPRRDEVFFQMRA